MRRTNQDEVAKLIRQAYSNLEAATRMLTTADRTYACLNRVFSLCVLDVTVIEEKFKDHNTKLTEHYYARAYYVLLRLALALGSIDHNESRIAKFANEAAKHIKLAMANENEHYAVMRALALFAACRFESADKRAEKLLSKGRHALHAHFNSHNFKIKADRPERRHMVGEIALCLTEEIKALTARKRKNEADLQGDFLEFMLPRVSDEDMIELAALLPPAFVSADIHKRLVSGRKQATAKCLRLAQQTTGETQFYLYVQAVSLLEHLNDQHGLRECYWLAMQAGSRMIALSTALTNVVHLWINQQIGKFAQSLRPMVRESDTVKRTVCDLLSPTLTAAKLQDVRQSCEALYAAVSKLSEPLTDEVIARDLAWCFALAGEQFRCAKYSRFCLYILNVTQVLATQDLQWFFPNHANLPQEAAPLFSITRLRALLREQTGAEMRLQADDEFLRLLAFVLQKKEESVYTRIDSNEAVIGFMRSFPGKKWSFAAVDSVIKVYLCLINDCVAILNDSGFPKTAKKQSYYRRAEQHTNDLFQLISGPLEMSLDAMLNAIRALLALQAFDASVPYFRMNSIEPVNKLARKWLDHITACQENMIFSDQQRHVLADCYAAAARIYRALFADRQAAKICCARMIALFAPENLAPDIRILYKAYSILVNVASDEGNSLAWQMYDFARRLCDYDSADMHLTFAKLQELHEDMMKEFALDRYGNYYHYLDLLNLINKYMPRPQHNIWNLSPLIADFVHGANTDIFEEMLEEVRAASPGLVVVAPVAVRALHRERVVGRRPRDDDEIRTNEEVLREAEGAASNKYRRQGDT